MGKDGRNLTSLMKSTLGMGITAVYKYTLRKRLLFKLHKNTGTRKIKRTLRKKKPLVFSDVFSLFFKVVRRKVSVVPRRKPAQVIDCGGCDGLPCQL